MILTVMLSTGLILTQDWITKYEFELFYSEVTELSADVPTLSMYIQHNFDRYEYLLLESLTDYRKSEDAIGLSN